MKHKAEITNKQQKILDFIQGFIAKYRFPPACHQIGSAFGIKDSTVHHYLNKLEQAGFIRRSKGQVRTIQILKSCNDVHWEIDVATPNKLVLKRTDGLFSEIIAVFNSRSAANTFLLENLIENKMVVLTDRAALAMGNWNKTEETEETV